MWEFENLKIGKKGAFFGKKGYIFKINGLIIILFCLVNHSILPRIYSLLLPIYEYHSSRQPIFKLSNFQINSPRYCKSRNRSISLKYPFSYF